MYSFSYDAFGKTLGISVGNGNLVDYTYHEYNGKIDTMTYANGKTIKYFYDDLDRIEKICYIENVSTYVDICRYTYDANGNLSVYEDCETDQKTVYQYDQNGNVTHRYVYSGDEVQSDIKYGYDEQQRLRETKWSLTYANSQPLSTSFSYDLSTGYLSKVTYRDAIYGTITPTYDNIGRTVQRVTALRTGAGQANAFYRTESFTYLTSDVSQTVLVSEYVSAIGSNTATYRYTYDDVGNITHIYDGNNNLLYRYTYDDLGQLTREENAPLGKTYVYTYDNAGNRTKKEILDELGVVQETVNYTYGDAQWGDLLTRYGDWNVEYDEIGNPTFIFNQVDETWQPGTSLTWDGRNLIGIQQSERINGEMDAVGEATEIAYNADGIRVFMQTPYAIHYYTVDGSTILEEKLIDSDGEHYLVYVYDEMGAPIAIKYSDDNTTFSYYFFEKNLQGDIVGIYNASGTQIGTYVYDAWGNVTANATSGISSTESWIVNNNPFRYRGYYYDTETGWYYLQTRYYNPEIGRFINGDDALYSHMLGYNMFAYCYNNPIAYYDPTGENGLLVAASGFLIIVDGPFPIGDIFAAVLIAYTLQSSFDDVETVFISEPSQDIPNGENESPSEGSSAELPNQGDVSEIPDAPPVDAGSQGKHVPGHNNDKDPKKSKWKLGENGVRQTQEAWKNGKVDPTGTPKGSVRIGKSSDGRTIRVHQNSKGRIHGYPYKTTIFPD